MLGFPCSASPPVIVDGVGEAAAALCAEALSDTTFTGFLSNLVSVAKSSNIGDFVFGVVPTKVAIFPSGATYCFPLSRV
jgi:hypothetical protein